MGNYMYRAWGNLNFQLYIVHGVKRDTDLVCYLNLFLFYGLHVHPHHADLHRDTATSVGTDETLNPELYSTKPAPYTPCSKTKLM